MIVFGQAMFRGTIVDGVTNESLIGVNVVMQGTSLGAATDIEGKFRIVGIPERLMTVRISCMGYEPQMVEIDFSQSKDVYKSISLRPTVIQGEEVVITEQMRGQTAAINQQVTSNTIVNVISEEKIKELPDANAAEAIGRLPGVSIQRNGGEASKVVLRGLSSKFSNIMIDGVSIPGTDQNSKEVDLSAISQGSLAGIELHKTLTPDQDGDAIAGAVNLVTRKAPLEREIRLELKGGYNDLMKSKDEYEFSARYAARFFDDILGVQIQGNTEKKIRSKDDLAWSYASFYNPAAPGGRDPMLNDYSITRFTVDYTDEVRTRKGGQIILDVNTPDSGSIKLTGVYGGTERNFMNSNRYYVGARNTGDNRDFFYRYRELLISTTNTSLQGKNYIFGMDVDWGLSYALSETKNPYDFELKFMQNSAAGFINGVLEDTKTEPEKYIIPHYSDAVEGTMPCSTSIFRKQENFDKDRTAHLNLTQKFTVSDMVSGEFKIGAKIKERFRLMTNRELDNNTYLLPWNSLRKDGSPIILAGTRFEEYIRESSQAPDVHYFLEYPRQTHYLLGKYKMYPLISTDALKEWYDLNKDGSGTFSSSAQALFDDYGVTERITSTFFMNTFNIGQAVTVIAGARVEQEKNEYVGKFLIGGLQNTGIVVNVLGELKDTTSYLRETSVLPNLQVAVRPTDFLTVRFAAYKALARPDYNLRLPSFIANAGRCDFGNPNLRNAMAWNLEVNTQVYSTTMGLISVSAFYKEIKDLFHEVNNMFLSGQPDSLYYPLRTMCNALDIPWLTDPRNKSLVARVMQSNAIVLTTSYNSPNLSYAWGFEFEHQLNFSFLPVSYLKPITLTYNVSITRSQTNIYVQAPEAPPIIITQPSQPGIGSPPVIRIDRNPKQFSALLVNRVAEGQPNLYGNVALGYDIGGFSARLSFFYQDEYVDQYSFDGKSDRMVDKFKKLDLALKQQISPRVTIYLNVNNLTNEEENKSSYNRLMEWHRPRSAELYGTTADIGVRLSL